MEVRMKFDNFEDACYQVGKELAELKQPTQPNTRYFIYDILMSTFFTSYNRGCSKQFFVCSRIRNNEIFRAIIGFIPIKMMNFLTWFQFPSQNLFRYNTMFIKHIAQFRRFWHIGLHNHYISVRCFISLIINPTRQMVISALARTSHLFFVFPLFQLAWPNPENLTAEEASPCYLDTGVAFAPSLHRHNNFTSISPALIILY